MIEEIGVNAQTITTPAGERLVVLAEADFEALVQAADDTIDRRAVASFRDKLAAGEEEFVPAIMVDRLLRGESRVRVWREHRGLPLSGLADAIGVPPALLSDIETGIHDPAVGTLRKLADALHVTIDELVGSTTE